MNAKLPIWIYIVLGLQMLLALAFSAFGFILGTAFSGETSLGLWVMLGLFLIPPPLCFWLARKQWLAGRRNVATMLAFTPIALWLTLNIGLGFVAR